MIVVQWQRNKEKSVVAKGKNTARRALFHAVARRDWRRSLTVLILIGVIGVVGSYVARNVLSEPEAVLPVMTAPGATDELSGVTEDPHTEPTAVTVSAVRSHPFDELRLERDRLRSRQVEVLQASMGDASISAARRAEAETMLMGLWELEALEIELEHLLRAQGYTSVTVLTGQGAHVVVDDVLDTVRAAQIGETVSRLAGLRRETITIVDAASAGR